MAVILIAWPLHIRDHNARRDLASTDGNFIEMHRAVMATGVREEFSGEEGVVASVLNSSDLKHASKLIVCVIYALVIDGLALRSCLL